MKVAKTIKTIGQCPKCGRNEVLRLYDTVDVETNKPVKAALCVCGWTFDMLTASRSPIANVSFSEQPSEAQIAEAKKTLLGAIMDRQCLHGREHAWRQLYNTNVGLFVQCRKCGRLQDKDGRLLVPDGPVKPNASDVYYQ